ncbi:MAG TPA: hypothetical protein VGR07_13760 [Thermoanaerobaculia bacterium]|nr:hypothetical protein [Thermoanaerobaculia bacterium]
MTEYHLQAALEPDSSDGGVRPAHLTLLDLAASAEVQAVLSRLAPLVVGDEGEPELIALLDNPNWRLHLIAAAGLLLRGPSPATLEALWSRIELGSWVVARLAATAFLLDDRFAERAKRWIEARYGPPAPPRGGIGGVWNVFAGQTAASLLALLRQLPGDESWIAEWEARPTVAAALAAGGEAGRTALDWRDAISAEIGRFAVWRRA